MPRYVIERQYLLPIYERLLIEAPNLQAACREASDEIAHPWSEDAERDFDNARPITITAVAEVPDARYPELQAGDEADHCNLGSVLYDSSLDLLAIPDEFRREDGEGSKTAGFA
jgi:hypothetical protein